MAVCVWLKVFPEDDVVDLSDSLIGPVGRVLSVGRTGSLSSIMERFTDNSSGGDLSNKGPNFPRCN